MKIEKGKLYYNTQDGVVEMPMSDMEVDEGVLTDKIAVHCPTKEDWEYVVSNGYDLTTNWYKDSNYGLYSGTFICSKKDYHVISISVFKEFYPEEPKELSLPIVDNSNIDNIIEALKIQTQLDYSIEAIERELSRLKQLKQKVKNILK